MPDVEFPKPRPHPAKTDAAGASPAAPRGPRAVSPVPYAELAVTSNFTFLTGASHPEELVERAAALGHRAAAIADTNTLAGVVRAHVAAAQHGIPLAVGCRVAVHDGPGVLVFPADRAAYARLCRLLTLGKRRAPKGECHLGLHDLLDHAEGLLAVVEPPRALDDGFIEVLRGLRRVFDGDRLSLAASMTYRGDDDERAAQLAALAEHVRTPLAATNRVLYHAPERRRLQDVLTCVRHGCTVEQAGFRLEANAERHLKPPEEMARLFAGLGETGARAVARSAEIAQRAAAFSLRELRYEYPAEPCPPGTTPTAYLARRAWEGAERRYPGGVPEKTRHALAYELALIEELRYEAYFLTCADIIAFARSRGILCQGRGGAANSAVCYCLGITEVDPAVFSLLFERFISRERREPPDIDIDFEHERREEVLQYIYEKYGRERAAMTAEVISYRGRSAVRDVGKALGLSEDAIDALAKNLDRWGEAANKDRTREAGLNPADPLVRRVIELSGELIGFPRHLSQHVGGMVITRGPLCDLVPIENAAMEDRTFIEWDKDDIDALGMLKVDCLGLGMLTCIRRALDLARGADAANAGEPPGPDTPPPHLRAYRAITGDLTDRAVYDMICAADTVGVFQIESRAQMSMLPRLRPRCFYDLVIEVAIVRPGPIQGGMVHPYLRRREGKEPVHYPRPEVEQVLKRTLGVPLFQEQAMQLAIVAAGFTPDQADGLRRAMAAWKRKGDAIYRYGQQLIEGMLANGYERAFAEQCFNQIKGFSEYGFPESHAASFALLVYVSAWLKRHRPAAFAAALINSQPMGFYQPAQIIRDAQDHGVAVRPIDVNHSDWDCTLEPDADPSRPALRLGMRLAKGLAHADAQRVRLAVQRRGRFATVETLRRASGVPARALRCLANADAFNSMGLNRQHALWQVRPLRDEPMPLFQTEEHADIADIAARSTPDTPAPEAEGLSVLPTIHPAVQVLHDYGSIGLSLKAHPIAFLRPELAQRGVTRAADLRSPRLCPAKRRVAVAGMVLCRQRPGTASGVTFITLEDETGIANLIVWRDTFEAHRRIARLSTILLAHGTVEREGEVVHLHAHRLESLDTHMPDLTQASRDFH